MSKVGDNIRKKRKLLGLSQIRLASMAGISQAGISGIESGKVTRMPYTDTIAKIASALDCSVSDLMGDASEEANTGQLTAQEKKLVEDFRSLNQQGREYVLQSMAMAVRIYLSGKSDAVPVLEGRAE